jgi:SAM-dependent methyltransferase
MGLAQWLYSVGYRYFKVPWDIGPRKELVELVESGRVQPGRAIDLGSGTGSNCVFLAERGFEVTGVDFAPGAIELGRNRAAEAGVTVNFVQDDLTNLRHTNGTYDLLVDYGTLDDLNLLARDRYIENVVPLSHPGSQFLLFCFEWEPRWWENLLRLRWAFHPRETEERFGAWFEIERYARENSGSRIMPGWAVYLMTRKGGP